jgi:hypothetical protein
MKVVAAAALCALGVASPALADSHSVSYSDWTIGGEITTLKFVLPAVEAQRLTGVDVPLATTKKLGEYLLAHVAVEGDGENCAPIDQGYDIGLVDPLAVGGGSFGFEVFFRCPTANPRVRVLKNTVLFERVRSHVNYARVRASGAFRAPVRRQRRVGSATCRLASAMSGTASTESRSCSACCCLRAGATSSSSSRPVLRAATRSRCS